MTEYDNELTRRLLRIGERVPIPCPDGIKGCAVFHFRVETDPTCKEAANRIKDLQAQIEHQQRMLNTIAWLAQRPFDPNEQLTGGEGYASEGQAGSEA